MPFMAQFGRRSPSSLAISSSNLPASPDPSPVEEPFRGPGVTIYVTRHLCCVLSPPTSLPPSHQFVERSPLSMSATKPKRDTPWISNDVLLHPDGSTQEGAAFREPSMIVKYLVSFSTVLSKAGVGPVIAWGDVAMMFYGIPTGYTRCHVLIPDRQFEDARKALLAEGYVDEPFTYVRWTDLGAPCCEMRNPRSPDNFSIFFLLGLSAVQPMFGDLDISSYKQIGGIAIPPLLTLALSFLYALTRSKSDAKGICLRTLLGCWCDYTKFYGYKPLGCGAMEGQPLEEKLMSFWVRGTLY